MPKLKTKSPCCDAEISDKSGYFYTKEKAKKVIKLIFYCSKCGKSFESITINKNQKEKLDNLVG